MKTNHKLTVALLLASAVTLPVISQGLWQRGQGMPSQGNQTLPAIMSMKGQKADMGMIKPAGIKESTRKIKKMPGNAVLWGNVAYMTEWEMNDRSGRGIYSFMATAPVGYPLVTDPEMQFCYGNAVVNGTFYGMTMDADRNARLYSLDTETWSVKDIQSVTDLSLVALATTEDYATQTVYGEFYNKDFNGYELGIIDYTSLTRTTVGPLNNTYVAMGFHDGILYGIATDGYLYAINASNGFENKRGATGLQLENKDGKYYMQGAEIPSGESAFYWAAIDKDGFAGMYSVDLTTGNATLCGNYSGIIYALTSPVETPTANDAPASVDNFAVEMNGIYNAEVSFLMPTSTYGGESLSGELSYAILSNGATIKSGVAQAGSTVKESVELSIDGTTIISAYARNAAGNGVASNATLWFGYDYPLPARGLNAVYDTDNSSVNISWNAPAGGANDGYIGDLRYDLYRYVNGEKSLIAEDIAERKYIDNVPSGSLSVVSYGIVADNNGKKGIETSSNVLTIGETLVPDFVEDFRTAENFRLWTVYDSNGDDRSWEHDPSHHYAYYQNSLNNADDWLISPGISMDSRRTYRVTVKANNTSNLPERLEVKLGKNLTAGAMTIPVLEDIKLMQLNQAENQFETHINDNVKVEKSGIYYLGLHAISDAGMNKLRVDSISVEAGPLASAPAAVGNLMIAADSNGALSASIAFNAPLKNIDGTSIEKLDKIEIKRGGRVIKTFENVAAGAEIEYTDQDASEGYNDYRVTAWADNEFGEHVNASVWVGYDLPAVLTAVEVAQSGDKVKLSWENSGVTGIHGGVVDLSSVSYKIYEASMMYGFAMPGDFLGSTSENEYIVDFDASAGPQTQKFWMVAPSNDKGEAEKTLATLLVGENYSLPFDEHFREGVYEKFWYLGNKRNVNVAVYPGTADSADNDGFGLIVENYATNDEAQDVISGKIDISTAANPTLMLDMKANPLVKEVSTYALTPDNTKIDLGKLDLSEDWTTHRISLSEAKGNDYVQLAFHFEFLPLDDTTWEYGTAVIDNINVVDLLKHNLVVEIEGPGKVYAGLASEPALLGITVKNAGENDADMFKVSLLEDGNEIWSDEISGLAAMSSMNMGVSFSPSSDYETKDVSLKAVVEYAKDEMRDDNEASMIVSVVESEIPSPENVTVDNVTGLLSWSKPDTSPEEVLEDFESYTPWITDGIGDWTLYDGDCGTVQGLFPSMANPVEGQAYAFAIFDPRDYKGDGSGIDMTSTYPNLAPHSGNQYLTSSRAIEGWNSVQQDNMIISPLLPCVDQTISFWVNNNVIEGYPYVETFSIWGSLTDKDIDSFRRITEDMQAASGEWTEIRVEIPAEYKYFAIRQTSGAWDAYFFMIDDITYSLGGGEISKYIIYVDGKQAGEVDADKLEFQIPDIENDHELAITALYTNGLESKSVKVNFEPAGIDAIISTEAPADIYNVTGYLVRSNATTLEGLDPGVYIVNGKKIFVY